MGANKFVTTTKEDTFAHVMTVISVIVITRHVLVGTNNIPPRSYIKINNLS